VLSPSLYGVFSPAGGDDDGSLLGAAAPSPLPPDGLASCHGGRLPFFDSLSRSVIGVHRGASNGEDDGTGDHPRTASFAFLVLLHRRCFFRLLVLVVRVRLVFNVVFRRRGAHARRTTRLPQPPCIEMDAYRRGGGGGGKRGREALALASSL